MMVPFLALGMVSLMNATADGSPELTVYNQGFALVKDQRTLTLKAGVQEVAVEDVAQMIEANSVGIRSISAPGSFSVLEQNYQYDLISVQAILNKAVGQRIAFNRVLPDGKAERIEGVLLSAPSAIVSDADGGQGHTWNGMVIRTDNGRILLNPSGEIEVSSIPSGLISKPTLMWLLDSKQAGNQQIELSYLTQGMSWKSDYVLALDAAGAKGDVKGWVTMTNNSGATFTNAKLKLLAGDVARVMPAMSKAARGSGGRELAMAADAGFSEETFADYHLYTLGRPATIRNREIKQVSLLEAVAVPVTKRLVVDAMGLGFRGYQPNDGQVGTGPIKPTIQIQFRNDKASNMGMPLPMGTVKVFQRDSSGSLQMLGESQIDHTPKDELITLTVGRAFDVVVERKRTQFEWIDGLRKRGARETFEIELRNRKETAETVTVYERHWGQWSITKHNMDFEKPDSETAVFTVRLEPNQVRKVVYTVETRW